MVTTWKQIYFAWAERDFRGNLNHWNLCLQMWETQKFLQPVSRSTMVIAFCSKSFKFVYVFSFSREEKNYSRFKDEFFILLLEICITANLKVRNFSPQISLFFCWVTCSRLLIKLFSFETCNLFPQELFLKEKNYFWV